MRTEGKTTGTGSEQTTGRVRQGDFESVTGSKVITRERKGH